MLDPASGGFKTVNSEERVLETSADTVEFWVTEKQYGGPNHLNDMEQAKAATPFMQVFDRLRIVLGALV